MHIVGHTHALLGHGQRQHLVRHPVQLDQGQVAGGILVDHSRVNGINGPVLNLLEVGVLFTHQLVIPVHREQDNDINLAVHHVVIGEHKPVLLVNEAAGSAGSSAQAAHVNPRRGFEGVLEDIRAGGSEPLGFARLVILLVVLIGDLVLFSQLVLVAYLVLIRDFVLIWNFILIRDLILIWDLVLVIVYHLDRRRVVLGRFLVPR